MSHSSPWEGVDEWSDARFNRGPRNTYRLAVPGGWIYYTEQYDPDEWREHGGHMPIVATSVFIPKPTKK